MKYAYIDEYGAYGFKFEDPGCTNSMILTAVIVDDNNVNNMDNATVELSKRFFGNGEMKSSSIGKNHQRRRIIMEEIVKLPFVIYFFVIDKTKIFENCGPRYKKTFYKFCNEKNYNELYTNFKELSIIADEIGGNEYIKDFSSYVRKQKIDTQLSLFDDHNFMMMNSKNNSIIQIADIISGSLSYTFDTKRIKQSEGNDYYKLLKENGKIIGYNTFPLSYDKYILEKQPEDDSYEPVIAEICYRRAQAFIQKNELNMDEDVKMQVLTLKYLLFRFVNNHLRKYISTNELISNLKDRGFNKLDNQRFRTKIIGRLRDANVIIASNSNGYKIPSTKAELFDYVNLEQSIIVPMIGRLSKCRKLIFEGTEGAFDIFEKDEYQLLKKISENS